MDFSWDARSIASGQRATLLKQRLGAKKDEPQAKPKVNDIVKVSKRKCSTPAVAGSASSSKCAKI
eukprot:3167237-Amphidinium_carterae.1